MPKRGHQNRNNRNNKRIGAPRQDRQDRPYRRDVVLHAPASDPGAVDERLLLSVLPGKLHAWQVLRKEIAKIRADIDTKGESALVALLPGLEEDLQRQNEALGTMLSMVGASLSGLSGLSSAINGIPDVHGIPVIPGIVQGHEPEETEPESPESRSEGGTGNAIDIASLFGERTSINGRPLLRVWIVKELKERGRIDRKDFTRRWRGEYSSLNVSSTLSVEAAHLRERGVKLVSERGSIVLKNRLVGDLPQEAMAARRRQSRPGSRNGTGSPPEDTVASRAGAASGAPAFSKGTAGTAGTAGASAGMFTGSVADILLQEFEAGDGVVNLPGLYAKYGTRRNSFHWAMSSLRNKHGLRIISTSRGVFRIASRRGRPPGRSRADQSTQAAQGDEAAQTDQGDQDQSHTAHG